MNDKRIEELMERVKLTDYSLYFRGYNLHVSNIIKKHIFDSITQAQRQKFLNDPDLALIDRGGNYPACPQCSKELNRVRQSPDSPLNADQFDAVKAGDWYCDSCKGEEAEGTTYKYWVDKEVGYIKPVTRSVIPLADVLKESI